MYLGIELRLLHCVAVLAEELNFTKASNRLRLAQPALSRYIRQVESTIGVTLFERTSRRVIVTEAGQRVVVLARQILRDSSRVFDIAKAGRVPERLVVGYPPHIPIRDVIHLSKLPVPGIRIREFSYRSLSATEIIAGLTNRSIDCGLITVPNEYPEVLNYMTIPVFKYRLGIVVSKNHVLAKRRNLGLADLKDHPLIFIAKDQDPQLWSSIERSFRLAGFSPRMVQEIRSPYEYPAFVEEGNKVGLGFGFSRNLPLKHLSPNLVVREFNSPDHAVEVAIMFGEKFYYKPLTEYVKAVTKWRDHRHAQITKFPLTA